MTALNKMFKSFKNEHFLGIAGLLVVLFALYKYSENKNVFKLGMTGGRQQLNPAPINQLSPSVVGASSSNAYAPFNGQASAAVSNSATSTATMNKPASNPADLLPADSNSAWASMNPVGDLKNINLLNPTQVVGINTQGSSLRNANLQLRSEPPNPRMNTNSPWNISTIEEDNMRKPLEIGQ
tara:strand:- start:561 stop:1106 length:546 start_codon:yes stop_codon:yes gene_type:complete